MKKITYLLIGGVIGALCGYGAATVIIAPLAILVSLSQDVASLLQPITWILDHPYVDMLGVTFILLGSILGVVLGYKRYSKNDKTKKL